MNINDLLEEIILKEFGRALNSKFEILGLGLVNRVFVVSIDRKDYVLRLNEDSGKLYEFAKEKWCIEKSTLLGVPGPKILAIGTYQSLPYMIFNKVKGINGSLCNPFEQLEIWRKLGGFANKIQEIEKIDELAVKSDEYHNGWSAKLNYNIKELCPSDSLLSRGIFSNVEQEEILHLISSLKDKKLKKGLVHGDQSPKNVIWDHGKISLLDWGSSRIDIVPHSEIAGVLMQEKLGKGHIEAFLEGMQIDKNEFSRIDRTIRKVNLLNKLDLYRWAAGNNLAEIDLYAANLKKAYEEARS